LFPGSSLVHLTNVVKAALVLPHGNADVERGVSVINRVVTAERNKLGEDRISYTSCQKTSLSQQESSIRNKLSGVGQLLKDGNVKLKDSINKNGQVPQR